MPAQRIFGARIALFMYSSSFALFGGRCVNRGVPYVKPPVGKQFLHRNEMTIILVNMTYEHVRGVGHRLDLAGM